MTEGIPDLGVPSLEPLFIPEIAIDKIEGVQLQAKFRNVTIEGPSKFRLRSVKSQIESDKLLMKLWFPELIVRGSYEIRGQILMMPINGEKSPANVRSKFSMENIFSGVGTCFGNFSDIDGLLKTKLKRIKNKDTTKDHYQVEVILIEFNIGHASQIKLENLFKDTVDPERALELSSAMNTFINENWRIVAAALKPTLETVIAEALREIADKIFAKYPIDSLLVS